MPRVGVRLSRQLLAKLLANGLSAPESCADRHALFSKNSHDRDTTVTYFPGSSPLIIPRSCVRITPGLVVFSLSWRSVLRVLLRNASADLPRKQGHMAGKGFRRLRLRGSLKWFGCTRCARLRRTTVRRTPAIRSVSLRGLDRVSFASASRATVPPAGRCTRWLQAVLLGSVGMAAVSAAQITSLRGSIDQGAIWPEAPAYALPLRAVAIPAGAGHPLDRLLARSLADQGVRLEEVVGDAEFARRTSLDLLGIPPTPTRLRAFLADESADKRSRWVDRLLEDQENFSAHWMTFWSDLLRIGSEVQSGTFDDDGTSGPKTWLKEHLDRDAALDELARGMMSRDFYAMFAQSVAPAGDILSAVERPEMQLATVVSQVFLGIQLKCASCHDSFVDRWKLQDAWGLAVALGEVPIEIHRCQNATGDVAAASFPLRELGAIDGSADVDARRKRVAELLTSRENGLFARTLANRIWARLFGRGLIEPLDEMMEHEPWNADLLDWLAGELVRTDYDLKAWLRLILASRTYQLPPVIRQEPVVAPAHAFRGPELRWLSAEQFVDSLRVVAQPPSPGDEPSRLPSRSWEQNGSRLMTMLGRPTRDVVVSARNEEPSPLRALELINGGELQDLVQQAAAALFKSGEPAAAAAERVCLAMLCRAPTAAELSIATNLLGPVPSEPGLADLIWSWAMQPEFQLVP